MIIIQDCHHALQPLGDARREGTVYTREFSSGTRVRLDVKSGIGSIEWPS